MIGVSRGALPHDKTLVCHLQLLLEKRGFWLELDVISDASVIRTSLNIEYVNVKVVLTGWRAANNCYFDTRLDSVAKFQFNMLLYYGINLKVIAAEPSNEFDNYIVSGVKTGFIGTFLGG